MTPARFRRALGRLAKDVVSAHDPAELWVRACELVGTATDADRVSVYRVSLREGIGSGLYEWLHPVTGAEATRAIYPLTMFASSAEHLLAHGTAIESHHDAPAPSLVADGADAVLHEGMSIRSLLWQPFALRDSECLLLVLNRTRDDRRWTDEERAFVEVAAGILEPAIELLEQRAALRATASRYRTLYDATPALFFTVDPHHRVVSANRYAGEHLGYPLDELVGIAHDQLVHPDDRAGARSALERAFAAPERHQRVVFRKLRRDGSTLWVREIVRVTAGPDGAQALIACEDITEQRRAEDALLAAQKLETLGVLAGGIAHDFNNLLATILGNLELSKLRIGSGEHALASIERAERGTLRAAELVRSLLSYSASTIERREPVRLDELIRELRELLQVSMAGSVELQVELGPDLPPVLADPAQLRQVLMNLVVNAAESIGRGGGRVVVSAAAEPGTVRLEVSDTGSGMSADTLDRIFDPFFTTKVHGRGLGLAAVRGIVRAHGGAISVRSAEGAGSTFTVTLPSAPSAAAAVAPAPSPAPPPSGGRVLVVDDDGLVRSVLVELVADLGYDPVEADGVTSGLAAYRGSRVPFVCALIDVAMPGGGGLTLLAELRRAAPRLPIVLMSGFAESDAVAAVQAGGAVTPFLQKPFGRAQLAEMLVDAILTGGVPPAPRSDDPG